MILLEFFDSVVTEDDVKHQKPDPRHLYHTMMEIKTTPSETVFVGDSETDIQGAKAFGSRALAALWCPNAEETVLKSAGADFLVAKPLECLDIFRQSLARES